MFSWFKKKNEIVTNPLTVDMHSHLLPGLDDGVKSFEEAAEVILHFQSLGYSKLITTPHVISDSYRNTSAGILGRLEDLKKYLSEKNINIDLHAAAEYYLDEGLMTALAGTEPLLTIHKNYLLFETNFLTEPFNLKEFIFQATTKGYKLILAHPERYLYLHNNLEKAEDLLNRGVQFQVNISSIAGVYSKQAQATAFRLIDKGWVHWLGSDCHNIVQARILNDVMRHKYFQKALHLPLLNNTIQ